MEKANKVTAVVLYPFGGVNRILHTAESFEEMCSWLEERKGVLFGETDAYVRVEDSDGKWLATYENVRSVGLMRVG